MKMNRRMDKRIEGRTHGQPDCGTYWLRRHKIRVAN